MKIDYELLHGKIPTEKQRKNIFISHGKIERKGDIHEFTVKECNIKTKTVTYYSVAAGKEIEVKVIAVKKIGAKKNPL